MEITTNDNLRPSIVVAASFLTALHSLWPFFSFNGTVFPLNNCTKVVRPSRFPKWKHEQTFQTEKSIEISSAGKFLLAFNLNWRSKKFDIFWWLFPGGRFTAVAIESSKHSKTTNEIIDAQACLMSNRKEVACFMLCRECAAYKQFGA